MTKKANLTTEYSVLGKVLVTLDSTKIYVLTIRPNEVNVQAHYSPNFVVAITKAYGEPSRTSGAGYVEFDTIKVDGIYVRITLT